MKTVNSLRVALVGCGNIAKIHLGYVLRHVQKDNLCICDENAYRLNDFGDRHGIVNRFNSLDPMLASFKPDIVHVLTPPMTHKDVAIACLQARCHVLIEKPVCVTNDEADAILKVALENKRMVVVDHMRLFDPLVAQAKEVLSSGSLGEVVNVSATYTYDYLQRVNYDAAAKWMNMLPGGAFFDVLPHPLCLLEEFIPGMRLESSVNRHDARGSITDHWSVFSSVGGVTGSLHLSLRTLPLKNELLLECSRGTVVVDLRNFLLIVRRIYAIPGPISRVLDCLTTGSQIFWGGVSTVLRAITGRLDPYAGMHSIISQLYDAVASDSFDPGEAAKAFILVKLSQALFPPQQMVMVPQSSEGALPEADILVTGGSGFIGKRLVKKLVQGGNRVRILSHQEWKLEDIRRVFGEGVTILKGDVSNLNDVKRAVAGVRKVFHLAAAMKGQWNYHLDTTLLGTENVCKACLSSGVRDLVYVSTLNVYKASAYPRNGQVGEDFRYEDHPERRGAYSHAKLRAEKIVREFQADHSAELNIVIIRPGLVYGPGGAVFPKDVGVRVGRHWAVLFGNGRRRLPLVYVDNLVDALLLFSGGSNIRQGIFNVVDSEYPSQKEFAAHYAACSGFRLFSVPIPGWILYSGFWSIETLVRLLFKNMFSWYIS